MIVGTVQAVHQSAPACGFRSYFGVGPFPSGSGLVRASAVCSLDCGGIPLLLGFGGVACGSGGDTDMPDSGAWLAPGDGCALSWGLVWRTG